MRWKKSDTSFLKFCQFSKEMISEEEWSDYSEDKCLLKDAKFNRRKLENVWIYFIF